MRQNPAAVNGTEFDSAGRQVMACVNEDGHVRVRQGLGEFGIQLVHDDAAQTGRYDRAYRVITAQLIAVADDQNLTS
jgi:hypothetical protein